MSLTVNKGGKFSLRGPISFFLLACSVSPLVTRYVGWFVIPLLLVFCLGGEKRLLFFGDPISRGFLVMTVMVFLVVLFSKNLMFGFLFFGILFCFSCASPLVFMVVFEFIMLPMVIVIFSRKTGERVTAIQFFVVYTLVFSVTFFVALVKLFSEGFMPDFLSF